MAFLDILSGGIELPNIELFTKKEQKQAQALIVQAQFILLR